MSEEVVPINISWTARQKTDRLYSVNELREQLWNLDGVIYAYPEEDQFHFVTEDDLVILFAVTTEASKRIVIISQTHVHEKYETDPKFEQIEYDSVFQLAHEVDDVI